MTTCAERLWDAATWLGRFHVVMIHFPIALLIGALALESFSLWRRMSDPAPAVRLFVLFGAAGAVLSTLLGWCAAPASYVAVPGSVFFLHRWLGTAAGVWTVVLTCISEVDQNRGRRSRLFRGALLAAALLIGLTGHFGGLLSHGAEFFDWPRRVAPTHAIEPAQLAALYQQHCGICHGVGGRGEAARGSMPAIPDFTDLNWQATRSEEALRRSILLGKPPQMPAFKNKLPEDEITGLALLIRGLALAREVPMKGEGDPAAKVGPPTAAVPQRRREQADPTPDASTADSRQSLRAEPAARSVSPPVELARGESAAAPTTAEAVFKKSCAVCHDADGKGASSRKDMPTIPDFTDRKWQKSRRDDELRKSILQGKGQDMPPMRGKLGSVTPAQMVDLVRKFGRSGKPGQPAGRSDSMRPARDQGQDSSPKQGKP